jgi:hypothetical protein
MAEYFDTIRCAASRSMWLVHGESVSHLLEAIATGDPEQSVRNEVQRIMREVRPQRPPVAETASGDSESVRPGKPEPGPQTQCGLCAVWTASGETMPLNVLQRAVAKGFNPLSRPELDMSRVTQVMTALGHSNHETWQMWAGEVSSQKPDTPRQDKFCPLCFKAVTEAADRSVNESPLGKASPSVACDATRENAKQRWWQFWR